MSDLTDAQIDAMPAGREMDALVAEAIGLRVKVDLRKVGTVTNKNGTQDVNHAFYRLIDEKGEYICGYGPLMHGYGPIDVPSYSEDIAAAWQVVTHFNRTHHWRICSPFTVGEPWVAGFTPHGVTGWNGVPDVQATGETAELAVSRVALKATLRSKEAGR